MTSSPDALPESVLLWIPPLLEPWSGERRPEPAAVAVAEGPWKPLELELSPVPALPRRSEAEEAFARGYDEGMRDGTTRTQQTLAPAVATLQSVTARIDADRTRQARDRERDVRALALAVARRLVMNAVADDPEVLARLVARALELMPADAPIEVRLGLADLEALSGAMERMSAEGGPPLRWVADPQLGRGSFVIESPARLVDGRIDVALRSVFEALDRE